MQQEQSRGPVLPRTLRPDEGERIEFMGEKVRVLADGVATGGRCFIFVETSAPGFGPPLHRHGVDDEFFFVLEGRYRFVMDGREFVAEPGAFVAAPRGSLHGFVNAGPGPGRMLVITSPAGLEGPFRESQAAERRGPLTPDVLTAIFGKFNLTFEGPPVATA